jgi:hypothetical protein
MWREGKGTDLCEAGLPQVLHVLAEALFVVVVDGTLLLPALRPEARIVRQKAEVLRGELSVRRCDGGSG